MSTPVPNGAADLGPGPADFDPGPAQHWWALLGLYSLASSHLRGAFAYAETFWLQEWKCGHMEPAQTAPEPGWKSLLQARAGQLLHWRQPCSGKDFSFTLVLIWPFSSQESCLNISALLSCSLELDFPVSQWIPAPASLCTGGNCIPLCGLLAHVDAWGSSQSVRSGQPLSQYIYCQLQGTQTIGKVYCALPTYFGAGYFRDLWGWGAVKSWEGVSSESKTWDFPKVLFCLWAFKASSPFQL